MASKFELRREDGGFEFELKAGNGEVILSSERFDTREALREAVEATRRQARSGAGFDYRGESEGTPYFVLAAPDGTVIGSSEYYSSLSAAKRGAAAVRRNAPNARIVDQTADEASPGAADKDSSSPQEQERGSMANEANAAPQAAETPPAEGSAAETPAAEETAAPPPGGESSQAGAQDGTAASTEEGEEAASPEDAAAEAEGERLLHAVERLLSDPHSIQRLVDEFGEVAKDVDAHADTIIGHYAKKAGWTGGLSALPAVLPGVGTLASLTTGALADMVLLLKLEAEMCMALAAAHGFDIHDKNERQLALLLATVHTSEVEQGRSILRDLASTTGTAIYSYGPRRVAKLLATSLAKLAAAKLGGYAIRAVPVAGVMIGAAMNRALTKRVGTRAHHALKARARPALATA